MSVVTKTCPKLLIICLVVISSGLANTCSYGSVSRIYHDEWKDHKDLHKLQFATNEDDMQRAEIFSKNLEYINCVNEKKMSYTLGMNQFGHWTRDEFLKWIGPPRKFPEAKKNSPFDILGDLDFPDIDHRKKGAVTPVKDQGQCGSCWAFSTTGALEALFYQKTGYLVSLSEQDLVDCSSKYGNMGCSGGLMDKAFDYVSQHGISLEQNYPYTASDGECRHKNITSVLQGIQHYDIPSGNEFVLQLTLYMKGPVSVAIDASSHDFMFYKSGVFVDDQCSPLNLDHGVLLVGMGNGPAPYYILKNSWGTTWGINGYMHFARNRKNMCGVATSSSIPF